MNKRKNSFRALTCLALVLCILQGLVMPARAATYRKGDTLTFGSYEQDGNYSNGPEPIVWEVLSVDRDSLLLLSRYGLDCKPFNYYSSNVTWETCSLRSWLNDTFYYNAFNYNERQRILETYVSSDTNSTYGTTGGSGTWDMVYIPSISEMNTYFQSNSSRQCRATSYARSAGAWYNKDNGYSGWWLRTPGETRSCAAGVSNQGYIYYKGDSVDTGDDAVRPMIRIAISNCTSHIWMDATPTQPKTCSRCGATEGSPLRLVRDIVYAAGATSTYNGDKASHSVYNLLDGDPTTNWTEGVKGYGIGEFVEFDFSDFYQLSRVTIRAGNHASRTWYDKNCRPKSVTLTFSDGSSQTFSLQDTMTPQTITLPRLVTTCSLRITINSVYVGSAYSDTVISEVSFTAYQ